MAEEVNGRGGTAVDCLTTFVRGRFLSAHRL